MSLNSLRGHVKASSSMESYGSKVNSAKLYDELLKAQGLDIQYPKLYAQRKSSNVKSILSLDHRAIIRNSVNIQSHLSTAKIMKILNKFQKNIYDAAPHPQSEAVQIAKNQQSPINYASAGGIYDLGKYGGWLIISEADAPQVVLFNLGAYPTYQADDMQRDDMQRDDMKRDDCVNPQNEPILFTLLLLEFVNKNQSLYCNPDQLIQEPYAADLLAFYTQVCSSLSCGEVS